MRLRLLILGFGWIGALLVSLFAYTTDGFPQRISEQNREVQNALDRENWIWDINEPCLERFNFSLAQELPWWFCFIEKDAPPSFGLIGSSRMNQMTPGLIKADVLEHHVVLSIGTCGLLMDPNEVVQFGGPNPCDLKWRQAQFQFFEEVFSSEPLDFLMIEGVAPANDVAASASLARVEKIQNYTEVLIVVAPWKVPPFAPQDCLLRPFSIGTARDCRVSEDFWEAQTRDWEEFKVTVAQQFPAVLFFDPNLAYCADGVCDFLQDGKPLMRDRSHISVFGSELVAARFAEWAKIQAPEISK